MEYLDYTAKTPETLDRIYGLPTQGVIGTVDRKNGNGTPLVTLFDSLSSVSEAFRTLRTNVHLAGVRQPVQTLLVTSAGPGEGKTFVASNLAVSLALNGSRVILVDVDLRKPSLHKVFSLSRETGFTNLVVNPQQNLDGFLQPTPVANLHVLTSGPIPPNPVELLDTPQARQLMQHLKEHADIVIYDTPPVATVTDASIVAQRVDAVIQVVWAGQTRINLVQRSKDILEHVGARILGPVLNKVKISDLGYYSYYYSYGYYNQNGNIRKHRTGLSRLLPRRKHERKGRTAERMEGTVSTVVDVDDISSNGVGGAHDLR
ncbi:MAG: CpsD/CapB family tyrosine-protein kinase [Chloroflexaceae bacterium]|nr:CpsD/CapB family tyrosine-protein kinase [Chloroflexaceae bacterium]